MQKKLIALALASLAGSAFAQSNVTVYGVVDLGQAWVKGSGATNGAETQGNVGRLDSNSSYVGFKGVEDLGNGLKALFQIEAGYNADNGGSNVGGYGAAAGRDSFVGLTGNFGTFVAGNLTHPLRTMGSNVELMPGAAGFGTTASLTGTLAGTHTGADDRAANALAYISPSFSGFSGAVAYVNGETKTNGTAQANAPLTITPSLVNKIASGTAPTAADLGYAEKNVNSRQWQVSGQYQNGPIYAALGYHKAYDFGNAENTDARVWRAAGTYTFTTNTKVTALYDNTKLDEPGSAYVKRSAWSLGVAQGFGKHTAGLEYARSGDLKTDAGKAQNTGASMWSALYTYELSKRTLVHARYSRLDNDSAAKFNFYNNPVANPISAANGVNLSGFMVGLRHSF